MALTRGYSPAQFRNKTLGAIGPFQVTATIPSTAAGTNGTVSVAVPAGLGLLPGDILFVIATGGGLVAGVNLEAFLTNATTLQLVASNGSAGAFNPGPQTYTIVGFRFNQA